MVDVMGHLGMGLLWALPAWFIWDGRVSVAFIGFTLLTAPLPDIDIWLDKLFPSLVHHHGVTHTIVFVVGVSVVAAGIAAAVLPRRLDRWLGRYRFDASNLFAFTFLAFLLGGLSHLFADVLSAPDIAQPIEPFWPFFDKPFVVDVLWYNDPLWNIGLLAAAVVLHVAVATVVESPEHRLRIGET